MKRIIKFLISVKEINTSFVFLATLIANILQGMSLAMLLPVIQYLLDDQTASVQSSDKQNIVVEYLENTVAFLGLSKTFSSFFILMLVFFIIKIIIQLALFYYINARIFATQSIYRFRFLRLLTESRWSYVQKQKSGAIVETLNRINIFGIMYKSGIDFISSIIQSFIILIILFLVSYKAVIVITVYMAFVVIMFKFNDRLIYKNAKKLSDSYLGVSEKFSDMISTIKTLKIMGRQNNFLKFIMNIAHDTYKFEFRVSFVRGVFNYFSEIILFLSIIFLILLQLWEGFSFEEFMAIVVLFTRFGNSVKTIQNTFNDFLANKPGFTLVLDTMTNATHNKEYFKGKKTPVLQEAIHVKNLTFYYKSNQVLNKCNAVFEKGKTSVIFGESGSGKTTLVDLLCGLYEVDEESIFIDKNSIENVNIEQWRKKIGYASQEIHLLNDTLRYNITLDLKDEIDDEEIWRILDKVGLKDYIKTLKDGLDTQVGERGTLLSGGQRQRISLARAMIASPEILILDEITSALDPKTEKDICNFVNQLTPKYTIIIITHRQAWFNVADVIYELRNGQCQITQ